MCLGKKWAEIVWDNAHHQVFRTEMKSVFSALADMKIAPQIQLKIHFPAEQERRRCLSKRFMKDQKICLAG